MLRRPKEVVGYKKGVVYEKRGDSGKVRVGFYYYEVIMNYLANHPEGKRIKPISVAIKIPYDTVRRILRVLVELNRVEFEERTGHLGARSKYYMLTKWRTMKKEVAEGDNNHG